MKSIKPIRGYWSHKILPLVYDDSLSYYEILCKVVDKVNELIEALTEGLTNEFVKKILENALLNVVYDEEDECISFTLDVIEADSDNHTFDVESKTMIIGK